MRQWAGERRETVVRRNPETVGGTGRSWRVKGVRGTSTLITSRTADERGQVDTHIVTNATPDGGFAWYTLSTLDARKIATAVGKAARKHGFSRIVKSASGDISVYGAGNYVTLQGGDFDCDIDIEQADALAEFLGH